MTARTRTRSLPAAAMLACALLPRPALADERAEARRHFRAGLALVERRFFREAIAEFEEANRILPNVNVLFNIARAYADLGENDRAIEYYQRYLTGDVPDRADVERIVRDLERRRREAATPTPAPTPAPTPTGLPPGAEPQTPPAPVGNLTSEQMVALRSAAQTILQFTQGALPAQPNGAQPNAPVGAAPVGTAPTGASPAGPDVNTPAPRGAGDDEAYEERLVTATLSAQSPLDSPSASSVITAQDIRLTGITMVPELLRRVAGVDVAELDSGDYEVGIRGFNRRLSNRVLVLVDGRSVYLDFLGVTLWSLIPVHTEEIERIEVIRGPGSALYGADAYSGVVNIITRAPGEGRSQASAGAGNGGRMRAMALGSGRAGALSYRMSAGYDQQQTYGRLVPDTDMTYRVTVPDPDYASRAYRADLDLAGRVGAATIRGGVAAAHDTVWFNALGPLRRFYSDLTFVQPWVQVTRGGFMARAFSNHVQSNADEYLQRVGSTSLGNRLFQNVFDVELRYAAQVRAGPVPVGLTFGASYRLKHITWNFLNADHVLNHFASYAQAQARLLPNLTALASARVDVHPVLNAPVFSPRVAVVYKPTERRALRLSAGTSFRTPTMVELYLDLQNPSPVPGVAVRGQGGEVSPGGRLNAENSVSVDVGFQDQTSDAFQYELNAFFVRGADLIELSNVAFSGLGAGLSNPGGPVDVGTFHYQNDPFATSVYGAEAGLRLAPVEGLDLYGNYTFAYTAQQAASPNAADQRTPQHKFNVGAQLRTRAGLDLSVDGHFITSSVWREQDFDPARGVVYETYPLDAYFQLNARAGYRVLGDRLELGVAGTNLTDNRARQHPFGAPLGARVMGTVTFRY